MSASNTKQFKVVLLGEGCVGKTSLVLRYCQNTFNDHHLSTLQVSFYVFDFVTTLVIENLLDYSWFLVCIKLEDGFQIMNSYTSGIISRQEAEHWRAASTLIYMGKLLYCLLYTFTTNFRNYT